MAAYDYDNLPEEMEMTDAVPAELFPEALEAFNEAFGNGEVKAVEAKAAYAYERHGHLTLDAVGGPRNKSYGSDRDDIIIQLTMRVSNPRSLRTTNPAVETFESKVVEAKRLAAIAKLEADLEADETRAAEATKAAAEKRDKLNALRAG
jgi:hypothetical protein